MKRSAHLKYYSIIFNMRDKPRESLQNIKKIIVLKKTDSIFKQMPYLFYQIDDI